MNERIRELAREAGFYISIDGSGGFIPDPHTEDITETAKKFAELIVRECEEVVRWAISVDSTIEKVPVLIREHFGVEE